MILRIFIAVALASAAVVHAQSSSPAMLYQQASAETIAERFAKLSADKNNRVIQDGLEVRIDAPLERALYTFTRPGHEAHPSMTRRAVAQREKRVQIQTTGMTAADPAAFEKWFAVFLREDQEIEGRLRIKQP